MATKPRIAWDSCVILDALDPASQWHAEVMPMYNDALMGKIEIVVSEISVAEVCKLTEMITSGRVTPGDAITMIQHFMNHPFIQRRPADRRETALAAEFTRDHNLETCDSIIV